MGQVSGAVSQHQRRERIRQAVLADGTVRIERLVEEYGVSGMTIHRDLDVLERQGWLRKVRGGATSTPGSLLPRSVGARRSDAAEAKSRIARHALRHLSPGQVVALDDSTSGLAVAERLGELAPLTVVTNFLPVINRLREEDGVHVIGLGGDFHPGYDAFFGLHAAEMAGALRSDVLLLSATAVVDGHCLHRSLESVQVKRALMRTAATRVLLADRSKFERRAVHELAPLTEFDLVVVDAATPRPVQDELREHGVAVEVAEA